VEYNTIDLCDSHEKLLTKTGENVNVWGYSILHSKKVGYGYLCMAGK